MASVSQTEDTQNSQCKLLGYDYWREKLNSAKYVVAPMVDQSELPWRMLSRRHGAQLCYTPMFHASNFSKDPIYRRDNFTTCPEDKPLIVQFCANDPIIFQSACEYVQSSCEGVDLNLGCPQTIAKRGHYGAFLQDEWELVHNLVSTAHRNLSVPISCKIRIFDDMRRTVDYAKMLESSGCQLLTVHGRTREQKGANTGLANWDHIKIVRESVSIPVFANGNIQYYDDVQRCLDVTGANGIMTAEGNLHNPALFENRQAPVWEIALEYLSLVDQYPCQSSAIRGHIFKLCHHSLSVHHDLRGLLAVAETVDEFRSVCQELEKRCQEDHKGYCMGEDIDCGNLPFPHWICQPYVRPATLSEPSMNVSKAVLAEIAATRKEIKAKVSIMAREAGLSKRKAKQYVKHNVSPESVVSKKIKAAYNSCSCGNPSGTTCEFTMCRLCCREKCSDEVLDCAGSLWKTFSIMDPMKRTAEPICTGTTVMGIVFDQGIAIAADTLASYGKMARYKFVSRLYKVNERTLVGVGGDYADYQFLRTVIETKVTEQECMDPNAVISPLALQSWLTAVLYNRRSNINPLWNNYIVGGVVGEDYKPYLATVNKLGVAYTNEFIATGLGSYLVQDTLENAYTNKRKQGTALTKAEAIALLGDCTEILFERDCVAHNEYEIGIVTRDGCEIIKAKPVVGRWEWAGHITGYE